MASSIEALNLNMGDKTSLEEAKASSQKGPCHRTSRSWTGCSFTLPTISEDNEVFSGADTGAHICSGQVTSRTLPNPTQELLVASLVDSGGPFAVAVASGLGPDEACESSVCKKENSKQYSSFLRSLRLAFDVQ